MLFTTDYHWVQTLLVMTPVPRPFEVFLKPQNFPQLFLPLRKPLLLALNKVVDIPPHKCLPLTLKTRIRVCRHPYSPKIVNEIIPVIILMSEPLEDSIYR
jgi:hypothetical protein